MANPTQADVVAALEAWAADHSASLDIARTAYQTDWDTFNAGWGEWAAAAGDAVADDARQVTATFNL